MSSTARAVARLLDDTQDWEISSSDGTDSPYNDHIFNFTSRKQIQVKQVSSTTGENGVAISETYRDRIPAQYR